MYNPASILDNLLARFYTAPAGSPKFADLWNYFAGRFSASPAAPAPCPAPATVPATVPASAPPASAVDILNSLVNNFKNQPV